MAAQAFHPAAVMFALLALSVASRVEAGYCIAPGGCPSYSVVSQNDKFETRNYDASKWVSTSMSAGDYDTAMQTAFQRLFNYISTNNIEMTTPVTTLFKDNKYIISFFIPVVSQASAPVPTNPEVFLESKAPFTAYVYQYGGWAPTTDAEMSALAANLSSEVKAAGLNPESGIYYSAGYNSPMQQENRHNEIWVIPADAPAVQASTGTRRHLS